MCRSRGTGTAARRNTAGMKPRNASAATYSAGSTQGELRADQHEHERGRQAPVTTTMTAPTLTISSSRKVAAVSASAIPSRGRAAALPRLRPSRRDPPSSRDARARSGRGSWARCRRAARTLGRGSCRCGAGRASRPGRQRGDRQRHLRRVARGRARRPSPCRGRSRPRAAAAPTSSSVRRSAARAARPLVRGGERAVVSSRDEIGRLDQRRPTAGATRRERGRNRIVVVPQPERCARRPGRAGARPAPRRVPLRRSP